MSRHPETYPVAPYKFRNATLDYKMGYRDRTTGALYATRFGTVLAVPEPVVAPDATLEAIAAATPAQGALLDTLRATVAA